MTRPNAVTYSLRHLSICLRMKENQYELILLLKVRQSHEKLKPEALKQLNEYRAKGSPSQKQQVKDKWASSLHLRIGGATR